MIPLTDSLVLQPSQAQVSLGQEVAATTGRVEERQRSQFVLVLVETTQARLLHLLFQYPVQLTTQVVQEERVNHLMDILYRGVMHAPAAPCFGVQCALKHSPEDGGRNLAPVEIKACVLEQNLFQLFSE